MILALDVGNSQIYCGVFDEGKLVVQFRRTSTVRGSSDELGVFLRAALRENGIDPNNVAQITACSVVPDINYSLRACCQKYFNIEPLILRPGIRTGLKIGYKDPKEVGADRIANAVGAVALYGGPTIVVDFGTGTTFDVISAAGEYLGGVICPGVEISLEALFDRAAALASVELVPPRNVIGRSTAESLQSGAIYGYAAQVDGLCRRIVGEIGPATVVGTGGLAPLISPHTACVQHVQPWLTLHGLRTVWYKNVAHHPDVPPGDGARGG